LNNIPELADEVFAKPLAPGPPKKETIPIRVDSDVLGFLSARGLASDANEPGPEALHDVAGQQRARPGDPTRRQASRRPKPGSKRAR